MADLQKNTNPPSWSPSFLQDPSNDLVLQSSDGVQFAVHKLIRSMTSPVFKDMFEVAHQPHPGDPVRLTEESVVLEKLSRFIYHRENPPFKTLNDVVPTLRAAHKYQVGPAVQVLLHHIVKPPASTPAARVVGYELCARTSSDSLRVYAVARRLGLRDLELAAREEWFNEDPLRVFHPPSSDVDEMPYGWYRDLLIARERRRAWFTGQTWDMDSYMGFPPDADGWDSPDEREVQDPFEVGRMQKEIFDYPCLKRIHTIMGNIHQYFEKTAILGALQLLHQLTRNFVQSFPEANVQIIQT